MANMLCSSPGDCLLAQAMVSAALKPEAAEMSCADLERLRDASRRFRRLLRENRRKAREFAARERREGPRNGTRAGDFEAYLLRKLQRAALLIEEHIQEHACEEQGGR